MRVSTLAALSLAAATSSLAMPQYNNDGYGGEDIAYGDGTYDTTTYAGGEYTTTDAYAPATTDAYASSSYYTDDGQYTTTASDTSYWDSAVSSSAYESATGGDYTSSAAGDYGGSTTGADGKKHWAVAVGKDGLTYTPNQLTGVAEGDSITFTFYPANHTVTQSSFTEPCTHLEGGLYSGFVPVAADQKVLPQWTVTVDAVDKPLWFYCRQGNHCSSGMVFAINAPTEGATFEAFLANAQAQTDYTWTAGPSGDWAGSGVAAASSTGPVGIELGATTSAISGGDGGSSSGDTDSGDSTDGAASLGAMTLFTTLSTLLVAAVSL